MIMLANCLITWLSILQSETDLSTMGVENVTLAHNYCNFSLILDGVSAMSKAMGLPVDDITSKICSIQMIS